MNNDKTNINNITEDVIKCWKNIYQTDQCEMLHGSCKNLYKCQILESKYKNKNKCIGENK